MTTTSMPSHRPSLGVAAAAATISIPSTRIQVTGDGRPYVREVATTRAKEVLAEIRQNNFTAKVVGEGTLQRPIREKAPARPLVATPIQNAQIKPKGRKERKVKEKPA